MYKRIKPNKYKMSDIKTGDYVLLAIPGEDRMLNMDLESRWVIINPNEPYDKVSRTNCYLFKPNKPITRGWYQVCGTRDGIEVVSIAKPHRRSKPGNPKWDCKHKANIYLNNILDLAKSRESMIEKREEML